MASLAAHAPRYAEPLRGNENWHTASLPTAARRGIIMGDPSPDPASERGAGARRHRAEIPGCQRSLTGGGRGKSGTLGTPDRWGRLSPTLTQKTVLMRARARGGRGAADDPKARR